MDTKTKRIKEKIINYFSARDEVIAVFLFGSYADNKERPFSDVDIGILIDSKDPDFAREKRMLYLCELSRSMRKDVHPVILNFAGEELLRQVFSKGSCLLVKDERKLAHFKTIAFSRIAEFGAYRKQMQAGLVRRIMEGQGSG
jgi:predicted nucleotidyltransferase